MSLNIAIIGAGIGGLTTAHALLAEGLHPQVFERTDTGETAGAGIVLPANAMKVFKRLGLADEIIRAGNPIRVMRTCDRADRPLAAIDLARVSDEEDFRSVAIARPVLHGILRAALPDGILRYGKALTAIDRAGAQVHFSDGASALAELVIGADGLNSTVRRLAGLKGTRRDSGQWCFRGIADLALGDGPTDELRELWGRELRFGYVALGPGKTYWYATFSNLDALPDDTPAARQAFLRAAFAGWGGPVAALIEAQDPAAILLHRLADMAPARDWAAPGLVLLGDAIHPTTPNLGQGAAMAIESAAELAHQLGAHGNGAAALDLYVTRRRARTAHVTRSSWRLGRLANLRAGWACAARDMAFRIVPDAVSARTAQKIFLDGAPG